MQLYFQLFKIIFIYLYFKFYTVIFYFEDILKTVLKTCSIQIVFKYCSVSDILLFQSLWTNLLIISDVGQTRLLNVNVKHNIVNIVVPV